VPTNLPGRVFFFVQHLFVHHKMLLSNVNENWQRALFALQISLARLNKNRCSFVELDYIR